jgi:hypothetical protein
VCAASPCALTLPDGGLQRSGRPAFKRVFHSDAALRATMMRGHIGLLESHFDQPVDVEGDLGAAFAAGSMADIEPRFHPVDRIEKNQLGQRRRCALTLDAWAERFERRWPEIQALDPRRFDERSRRIWRSCLVGCAQRVCPPAGFTRFFRIVYCKGHLTRDSHPMKRVHLPV